MRKFINQLGKRGYRKSSSNLGYWKFFDSRGYQIAVFVWDWRDSQLPAYVHSEYGVSFKFILGNFFPYSRWDMTISSKKMTIIKFEKLCKKFYEEIVLNE